MKQLTVILFILLTSFSFTTAQESLQDGVIVEGEISDEVFAVEYTYKGTEGQVIVLELFPADILGDYDRPSILLLNSAGEELLRRDGFGQTTALYILPADDTYTIIASRYDDAQGISIGEYTLRLSLPPQLTIGDPVSLQMTSEDTLYYRYTADEPFNVTFARSGDFAPEISVNTIDMDVVVGSLDALGGLYGDAVTQGTMGTFQPGQTYIIKLGSPLFSFSFSFDDPTSDITFELTSPQ